MRLIDADAAIKEVDDLFNVCEDNALIPCGVIKALVEQLLASQYLTPTIKTPQENAVVNVL